MEEGQPTGFPGKCCAKGGGAGACAAEGATHDAVVMSAAEIIELIEKLPAAEQAQVRDYMEKKAAVGTSDPVRRMDLAKAKQIGEGVFDRHPELFRRLAQ